MMKFKTISILLFVFVFFIGCEEHVQTPKDVNVTDFNVSSTISIPNQASTTLSEILSLDISSYFGDVDNLTFRAIGLPVGLSMSELGTITGRATIVGSNEVVVTATDSNSNVSTGTFTWIISLGNSLPKGTTDSISIDEETETIIDVLANDTDENDDNLTIKNLSTTSHGGTVNIVNNKVKYTPNINFVGTETFTYTPYDGTANGNLVTVTVNVKNVNDAPVADDDSVVTLEDTDVTLDITSNDIDEDGDTLSIIAVENPTAGTVVLNEDGTVTFTPEKNYVGVATFDYNISDGILSDTATVTVTITAVNDAPIANKKTVILNEDTSISIILSGDDIEEDTLSYTVETNTTHGTLDGTAPTLIYTPNTDFYGRDSFTFRVNDGTDDSGIVKVEIIVRHVAKTIVEPPHLVNSIPIAKSQIVTLDGNKTLAIILSASDDEGDRLNYIIETNTTHGILSGVAPTLIYTPNSDYYGEDSFTFKVNDGELNSSIATVSIEPAPTTKILRTGQMVESIEYDDHYYKFKGVARSFSRDGANIIDNVTHLIWKDDVNITKIWTEAKSYCAELPLIDGDSWRLPTIKELTLLTDKGRTNPAIDKVFKNIVSSEYWSSNVNINDSLYAWSMNFNTGSNNNLGLKTDSKYVRCVREATSTKDK